MCTPSDNIIFSGRERLKTEKKAALYILLVSKNVMGKVLLVGRNNRNFNFSHNVLTQKI